MIRFKSIITISRPVNMLISVLAVYTGYYLGHGVLDWWSLLIAGFTAAFLLAGANAINDVFDEKADALNRPHRPIPSGLISKKGALYYAVLCFALTIIFNLTQSVCSMGIVLIAVITLIIYTPWLKPIPLIGNMAAALIAGAGFLYGASVAGEIRTGIIPGIIAFLLHLVREIVKDMEDKEGDERAGLKTLAIRYAPWVSHGLVLILLPLVYGIIVWAFTEKQFNVIFLGINSAMFVPLIGYTFIHLSDKQEKTHLFYSKYSFILKLCMIVGTMSFILGKNI